jgi:hypothetical protein
MAPGAGIVFDTRYQYAGGKLSHGGERRISLDNAAGGLQLRSDTEGSNCSFLNQLLEQAKQSLAVDEVFRTALVQ